jgi:hypothetical protein
VFFLLHPRSCASACHAGTGCSPRSPVSASRAGSLCSPRKRRFRFSRSCRLSQAQKSNDTVRASPVHARPRTTATPFPHPHPNMSLAASTSRVAVRLPTLARVARKSGARAVTTTRASSAETVRNLLPEKPATLRTSPRAFRRASRRARRFVRAAERTRALQSSAATPSRAFHASPSSTRTSSSWLSFLSEREERRRVSIEGSVFFLAFQNTDD